MPGPLRAVATTSLEKWTRLTQLSVKNSGPQAVVLGKPWRKSQFSQGMLYIQRLRVEIINLPLCIIYSRLSTAALTPILSLKLRPRPRQSAVHVEAYLYGNSTFQ